jgi:DNA-binding NtrC family response regulator
VESMVVLSPGREIVPDDIPPQIRDGAVRGHHPLVPAGPVYRGREGGGGTGREFEFILRSLVELKLQVEELRRRVDERVLPQPQWLGEIRPAPGYPGLAAPIEPADQPPPPNVVTVTPGMTMAEIERAAIEAALRETRGNRRRAAEMLGIGERTLYRKLKEQPLADDVPGGDGESE